MCAIVTLSDETVAGLPIGFSHDAGEIRVPGGRSTRQTLLLMQAVLLVAGVPQEHEDEAVCWCGEPIPVPALA